MVLLFPPPPKYIHFSPPSSDVSDLFEFNHYLRSEFRFVSPHRQDSDPSLITHQVWEFILFFILCKKAMLAIFSLCEVLSLHLVRVSLSQRVLICFDFILYH